MRILVLGAGVQGTLFAVRLARAGHHVTLLARPQRAAVLRNTGAIIQDLKTMQTFTQPLQVLEELPSHFTADICLVTVRREQIESVLPDLVQAVAIPRIVFLMNVVGCTHNLSALLGPTRTVLAFPGIAGELDGDTVRYLDIPQQHTAVEKTAHDVIALFRDAHFPVDAVRDMDAWLQRHTVFITAIAGALYECSCDALLLAKNPVIVRRFILAVREGWAALDCKRVGPAPFALRVILCWVPLLFSVRYWSRLLASSRGDIYFARHVRHAPAEMASLADYVRKFTDDGKTPMLQNLLASIDARQPPAPLSPPAPL